MRSKRSGYRTREGTACRILVNIAACSSLQGLANCGASADIASRSPYWRPESIGTRRVGGGACHFGGDSCQHSLQLLLERPVLLLLLLLGAERHMLPCPSSRPRKVLLFRAEGVVIPRFGVITHELLFIGLNNKLCSFSSNRSNAALPLGLNWRRPTVPILSSRDARSLTSSTTLINISRFLGRVGFLSNVIRRFLEFWT